MPEIGFGGELLIQESFTASLVDSEYYKFEDILLVCSLPAIFFRRNYVCFSYFLQDRQCYLPSFS
jgi:hypothetical protein